MPLGDQLSRPQQPHGGGGTPEEEAIRIDTEMRRAAGRPGSYIPPTPRSLGPNPLDNLATQAWPSAPQPRPFMDEEGRRHGYFDFPPQKKMDEDYRMRQNIETYRKSLPPLPPTT